MAGSQKKARHDAARANAACSVTGNSVTIPSFSEITEKILDIIGSESAYGMAGLSETLVGEVVGCYILFHSFSPLFLPLPTHPSRLTSVADQPSVPTTTTQPSVPSTTKQPFVPTTRTHPTRVQRAQSVKNEFLASDAETRQVLLVSVLIL